ncbi:MAG: hypothetical protein AAGC60_13680 [Acidobacteriota bacterium]
MSQPRRRITEDELLGGLAEAARERLQEPAPLDRPPDDAGDEAETRLDRLTDEIVAEHGEHTFDASFRDGVKQRLRAIASSAESARPSRTRWTRTSPRRSTATTGRWLALAAGLLVAAGLALLVGPRWMPTSESTDVPGETIAPPLPAYSLQIEGVDAQRGSDDPPTITVVPGLRLRLVLRPESAPTGAIAARLFLETGDEITPWAAAEDHLHIGPRGVIRLEDPPTEVWQALVPGLQTLYVAVGRPDALPDAATLRHTLDASTTPDGWQLLSRTMLRAEEP